MSSLGIGVRRSELRAVLVHRGRVAGSEHVVVSSGESWADGLHRLLALVPLRGRRWTRTTVAIGLAHSQVRRIDGLPPTRHSSLLTRVVRESAASFFPRAGSRTLVSDVVVRADGSHWAAAVDADLVDQLGASLRAHGLTRVTIIPAIIALAARSDPGQRRFAEDGVAIEALVAEGGTVGHVRRLTDAVDSPTSGSAPVDLGEEFAVAFAAATAGSVREFTWQPEPDLRQARAATRLRLIGAGALCAATAAAAVVAPGIRAQRTVTAVSFELARSGTAQAEAARAQGELARVSARLDIIKKFSSTRGQMTLLLGAIAQTIPESTAIVTLHVDTLEGSFVALTSHAADLLPRLADADPVVNARIVGSVTRETIGAARLERASVRFRRPRATAAASTAATTSQRRGPRP